MSDAASEGGVEIRRLGTNDPPGISAAFAAIGWTKPVTQFERYLAEQTTGDRVVLVARVAARFAGYATLRWESRYGPFRVAAIPEIEDLNVLPDLRRRGFGTRLLRAVEAIAATRAGMVGIGVGLHREYGAAQRLYVKLGFVPDGNGVAYAGTAVDPLATVTLDDDLTLYLTKSLERPRVP